DDKAKGIKTDKSGLEDTDKTSSTSTQKDQKPKTFVELEIETRESSLKTMDDYFSFVKDLDREDWFSGFLNAIAERFDPHTSYFAPEEKEIFDVSRRGKF